MNKAAKLISSSIIEADIKLFIVNNKQYTVFPPTIHKISGAISHLCEIDLKEGSTLNDFFFSLKETPEACTKALSWFITGDESIEDELSKGTFDEIVNGLEASISLISTQVFLKAVSLAKSVTLLAAKPKL